jgi:hypothetical protein
LHAHIGGDPSRPDEDLGPWDDVDDEDDPLLEIVVLLCYAVMALAIVSVLLFEMARILGG